MKKYTSVLIFFILLGCSKSDFTILENHQGYLVKKDDKPVLFYQSSPKSMNGQFTRAHYIHPLYHPDGSILTEDFPDDHLHQRGIYWAWHQFYIGDKHLGDAWTLENFSYDVKHVRPYYPSSGGVALETVVDYKSSVWLDDKGDQIPFVRDSSIIRIWPAKDVMRKIDFEINLLALEDDLRIGGSEDDKGYGGFSIRIRMPEDLEFISKNGKVSPQRTAVPASPWMDFTAMFSQKSNQKDHIILISHPSNPGHPPEWIIRQEKSMQNPVYPGSKPVALSTDEPLTLKYRLVIYTREPNPPDIDTLLFE